MAPRDADAEDARLERIARVGVVDADQAEVPFHSLAFGMAPPLAYSVVVGADGADAT